MNFDDDPLVFQLSCRSFYRFDYIYIRYSLLKKCPYSETFWSLFSLIWTEYREIRSISPYSVQIAGNTDQEISEYGHFSRNDYNLSYRISKQTYLIYFSAIQNEL